MAETGTTMIATLLLAAGVTAATLLGVWAIVARYDSQMRDRIETLSKANNEQQQQGRDRMDAHARETGEQLGQLRERIDAQGRETAKQIGQLRERIDAQGKETNEQLGQLRERMAKLEGLREGLREAITGKRAA